jgi:hypothetical protein
MKSWADKTEPAAPMKPMKRPRGQPRGSGRKRDPNAARIDSRAYSAALTALRDRYPAEFDELLAEARRREGLE